MESKPELPEGGLEETPEQKRKSAIRRNREKLAKLIADKVLEPTNYGVSKLFDLQERGRPLTREKLGNRALVLSQQDLEALGFLEIVLGSGERIVIDPDDTGFDDEDAMIIFPDDLGELEDE